MGANPDFDRDSLQSLLSNTFAVQESGLDHESIAALVEIQRAIGSAGSNIDRAIDLIAEAARQVAEASGVGIALLQGDQLVHRSGSGSASENVGRHFTAVLSTQRQGRPEILRVENAQADSRIEADICRQFDSLALLMLPIFRDHSMIGVLEVFFREPHAFQPSEVRTYQLMATLVGLALSRRIQHLEENVRATPSASVSHAIWRLMSEPQQPVPCVPPRPRTGPRLVTKEFAAPQTPWYSRVSESVAERLADWSSWGISRVLPLLVPFRLGWTVAIVPLLIGVAIAISINHHRNAAAHAANSAPPILADTARAPDEAIPVPAALPVAVRTNPQSRDAYAPNSSFKRVRVAGSEIDYVADDVTVRHFGLPSAEPQHSASARKIHFGEDVTVRYFDQPSASSAEQTVRYAGPETK